MRLGQFAKKYDVPVKEIISYLEEQTGEKFHPNAKLYDTIESKIFDHFELIPQVVAEEVSQEESVKEEAKETTEPSVQPEENINDPIIEEKPLPATPEEEIAAVEGEILNPSEKPSLEEEVDEEPELVEIPTVEKSEPAEDEIIQTDKLLEMLESEDAPADLDKIKLIKASKRELSGLKVLGKVDLPEPKKKEEKEEKESQIVTEKDLREYRNPRKKRQPLSEEEKEKRRLRAKRKKEEYEARQEKRQKEREEQEHKSRKEQHYKKKLTQAKAVEVKRKTKHKDPTPSKVNKDIRPEPKTMLGKFWRWMNT